MANHLKLICGLDADDSLTVEPPVSVGGDVVLRERDEDSSISVYLSPRKVRELVEFLTPYAAPAPDGLRDFQELALGDRFTLDTSQTPRVKVSGSHYVVLTETQDRPDLYTAANSIKRHSVVQKVSA